MGGAVYVGIVTLAVAVTWFLSPVSIEATFLILSASAAMLIVDGSIAKRERTGAGTLLPFYLLQAILASLVVLAFATQGSIGISWLIFMPLLASSVLSSGRGVYLVLLLIGAAVAVAGIGIVTDWRIRSMAEAAIGFSAAGLFVLIIGELTLHERRARAEAARLAQDLVRANQQLKEFAAQAEDLAIGAERSRIARELHDSLGHVLTTINIQLEAARAMLPRDPGQAESSLIKSRELALEGLRSLRQTVVALRAEGLPPGGLPAAIQGLAGITPELSPTISVVGAVRPLASATELALYRIAQEALTNVRRHSRAASAKVVVDYSDSASVRLVVSDDGEGAVPLREGFGLMGIRERTAQLGGRLEIRSQPGFEVDVEVPG